MRLVIDQDQVICDWVKRILEWYNEDKGTSFTKEDIKTWNMSDNLGPHSVDFLRSCMRYPELYRDLEPIEGAVYGMKKLHDDGHDVIIATAVPKCAGIAYHGKLEWIRRNMPWFNLNNFVAIQRKDLLSGDLILDDGEHNIKAWREKGRKTVVFDAPWNQGVESTYRVKHWNEFLEIVDKLQAEKELNAARMNHGIIS